MNLGPTMRGYNSENNDNIIISNKPRDRIVSKSKILPWYNSVTSPLHLSLFPIGPGETVKYIIRFVSRCHRESC